MGSHLGTWFEHARTHTRARTQIYTRPTYEFFELKFARHDEPPMSRWNCLQRAGVTLTYIVVVTTVCCAVPFFIDFVALV
jgi:hypothetical protein